MRASTGELVGWPATPARTEATPTPTWRTWNLTLDASTTQRTARRTSILRSLLVAQLSVATCLVAAEVTFRVLAFDFAPQAASHRRMPVFYRQPTLRAGTAFRRRPGPDRWTGKVLATFAREIGGDEAYYRDETAISVTYDDDGFRNPDELTDWDIVIVGDSFTELGYLPYEDLFTSRTGDLLGARVKNLGVSYTGPLTHCFYLREYGKAPSTRHAVLAFFEGNDLGDMLSEESRLLKAAYGRTVPVDPLANLPKQTSFFKAAYHLAQAFNDSDPYPGPNASFDGVDGRVPLSLNYTPPRASDLSPSVHALLENTLNRWAQAANELNMKPWLLYIPCKFRALHERTRLSDPNNQRYARWRPTDLPSFVRGLCDRTGIRFIDATPALTAETRRGVLTYNAVYDTHLNRHGSSVVARTLANAMAPILQRHASGMTVTDQHSDRRGG